MEYKDEILEGLTLDSFLGDSSQRYFSSNFKKVFHDMHEIKIENEKLFAFFSIKWPKEWSIKNGISLQPHIGTLDFFLIASRSAEAYFKKVKKLHDHHLRNMWILEFHCKAGNKCKEKSSILCECLLISEKDISEKNKTEYILEIKIEDTIIVLKTQLSNTDEKMLLDIEYCGSDSDSYYVEHYKEAIRDMTNIRIQTREKNISANYELKHTGETDYKGIGSDYMPCVTFCDLVLACGQLSQIILYQIDNTTREKASNLWLRNIRCFYRKPIRGSTNISVKVKESKMLRLKGAIYNCSDLVFNFNNGDLIAECSSAYQPFENEK